MKPGHAIDTGRSSNRRAADRLAALGEMTGGITHDFRNILAVIDAGVCVAERHANEPDQVRLCLAGVREGVKRGFTLTSRLLGFAAAQDRIPQSCDLNDLLRQLSLFLRYGAGPDVRVLLDLAPALPSCAMDAAEFNAAILNLVVNARDAMPGGGVITIRTSVEAEPANATDGSRTFVHLGVSDTGQGMPPDVLRKVFDRYFTTKGEAGTGLGVPQVCAFVRKAGGHIDVKSAVGIGTTFILSFPVHTAVSPQRNPAWRQFDRRVNDGGAGAETFAHTAIKRRLHDRDADGAGREPLQLGLHPNAGSRDRRRSPTNQPGGRDDRND